MRTTRLFEQLATMHTDLIPVSQALTGLAEQARTLAEAQDDTPLTDTLAALSGNLAGASATLVEVRGQLIDATLEHDDGVVRALATEVADRLDLAWSAVDDATGDLVDILQALDETRDETDLDAAVARHPAGSRPAVFGPSTEQADDLAPPIVVAEDPAALVPARPPLDDLIPRGRRGGRLGPRRR